MSPTVLNQPPALPLPPLPQFSQFHHVQQAASNQNQGPLNLNPRSEPFLAKGKTSSCRRSQGFQPYEQPFTYENPYASKGSRHKKKNKAAFKKDGANGANSRRSHGGATEARVAHGVKTRETRLKNIFMGMQADNELAVTRNPSSVTLSILPRKQAGGDAESVSNDGDEQNRVEIVSTEGLRADDVPTEDVPLTEDTRKEDAIEEHAGKVSTMEVRVQKLLATQTLTNSKGAHLLEMLNRYQPGTNATQSAGAEKLSLSSSSPSPKAKLKWGESEKEYEASMPLPKVRQQEHDRKESLMKPLKAENLEVGESGVTKTPVAF